jgi:hypothetical protein
MSNRPYAAAALIAALALLATAPAAAIHGQIQITHAKALAGSVTPAMPRAIPSISRSPARSPRATSWNKLNAFCWPRPARLSRRAAR